MNANQINATASASFTTAVPAWAKIISSPALTWFGVGATVIAYFSAIPEHRFVGAVASALTYALVQWLLPGCRPIASTPLCPWNWALFLFGLQLVILPFSVLVAGPSPGVLPYLPSDNAINVAMFIGVLAFIAFSITYQCLFQRSEISNLSRNTSIARNDIAEIQIPRKMIPVYFLLGMIGLFLAFGSIGGYLNYFEDPAKYIDLFQEAAHTLSGVASLFLRPFLGFGLVMLWCGWIDRQTMSPRKTALVTLLAMLGVILSYATFSYNRGAFVVPLISMLGVLLARGKRVSIVVIALAGGVLVAVLLLAPFYAVYRNADLTGNRTAAELLEDPAVTDFFTDKIDIVDTMQMYASGPQYLGYLLEESHWGTRPYLGSTLFASLVEPIPVLGRSLAESNGPVIYNRMIYGTSEIFDQIVPFASEMFLNFNILGVIVGFCFLAKLAFWLQKNFEKAASALEVYIWQYTAVWVLFLIMGSISIVSQVLFYFYCPIYLYFWWMRSARQRVVDRIS